MEPTRETPRAQAQPTEQPTRKVVIVDDDPSMLESTSRVLETLGYTPVALEDPAALFDVVANEHPVAILQDLQMTGVNLPGVVAALQSDATTSAVPLVFFSANPDVAHTASRYGAWGYLEKPFSARQLAEILVRAANPTEPPGANSAARRQARASFHEYWNTLASLSNYAYLLRHDERVQGGAKAFVEELDDLVLRLQAETQRLQAYILAMIA